MHALDLRSLVVDVVLLAGSAISGVSVLIFLIMHRKYVFWRLRTALLWLLILGTTTCLALALNDLLWDGLYQGHHYTVVGCLFVLVFPAVWLPLIGLFRSDRDGRSVWRAVGAMAIFLSILVLVWIVGETMS